MRVLYLTTLISANGRSYLRGREFAHLLEQEESLLLRHCWMEDRYKAIAGNAGLEHDVTDFVELSSFRPQVIFAETGLEQTPGSWRLPSDYLEAFVSDGGVVVVEGIDSATVNQMAADERGALFALCGVSPELGINATDVGRLHDEANNSGHPAQVVCRPDRIICSDWLRPTYEGIDAIVAGSATPLVSHHSLLASSESTAMLLANDSFVSAHGPYPWASVKQIGHGFVAVLAAGVVHDVFVQEYPDNARWLSNVMKFLVDEAARNSSLYAPAEMRDEKPPPAALAELIADGESLTLEFKASLAHSYRDGVPESVVQAGVLKTIAAFLNTDGGTLVIGVEDSGTILGIEPDFELKNLDKDRYENMLSTLVMEKIDKVAVHRCGIRFENHDGATVCIVDVLRAPAPVYAELDKGKKKFFVRVGNTTREYEMQEAVQYIKNRWGLGN